MYRQSEKNSLNRNTFSTCPHNMVNFSPLYRLRSVRQFGHPSKFQRVSRLAVITALTSLNGGQPNFSRCLTVSWAGTLYIRYRGLLPPNGISSGAKSTCVQIVRSPILAALFCTALEQWASAKLCGVQQRAPPIFGRAPSRWAWAHIL